MSSLSSIRPSRTLEPSVEYAEEQSHNSRVQQKDTPLPKLQLFILLYLQLSEPITSTVVYPFVNQLVRTTGITGGDDRKTGYFSGLIESSFYATEALCVLQWGRASDRIGRKPVILSGLLGLTLSMLGFGLSKTYWALVLSRCAQGALNGNIGVTKSMMTEITDTTNRAKGLSFLPMVWFLGGTIGPVIGGILSLPRDRWPHSFNSQFWSKYPYFLPCITAACFPLPLLELDANPSSPLSSNATADLQKTTQDVCTAIQEISEEPKIASPNSEGPSLDNTQPMNTSDPHTPPPTIRSLMIPRIIYTLVNYAFLAFADLSMTVMIPLMYSTAISQGGLNFSTFTIGVVMGVWGVINGAVQVLVFAPLFRRFGPRRLYMTSYASFLLAFCAFPLMAFLTKRSGQVNATTWVLVVIQLGALSLTTMTWGCIFIYVSDAAPNQAALGLTNGLAQTTASVMRAIAPVTSTSLFSLSLERNLAGGTMVYWILCAIVLCGIAASFWLPRHMIAKGY